MRTELRRRAVALSAALLLLTYGVGGGLAEDDGGFGTAARPAMTGAAAAGADAADASSAGLAIRVAKVVALDDADTVVNDAVVLVRDKRIEAVGPAAQIEIPSGYRVLTFPEQWLVPGIVDAHNHSAAGNWSDLNDMVYQTNPGLDSRPVPQPDNRWIQVDRTGGVTTVMMIPGSGTNLSGFGTVVSTGGKSPDDMILRSPGSLKIAQAGNPEWYFGGNNRGFMNWNLRQTLRKARDYHERWLAHEQDPSVPAPAYDPIWHGFRAVFRHDAPVTMHTQMYQVLMTTLDMVYGEFKLWTVLDHCTFDAWKLGGIVAKADVWTVNGPRQYHFDRTSCRMIGNASGWWKNGVRRLGINTDAPVIPQKELTYQAAMACWYGWLPYPALRGITNINAKSIMVYDQLGSVEPGKRADLSIWTGDPIDPRSTCLMTIVNGEIVYDGTRGIRRF